jgi:hypothetical protein
MNPFPLFLQVLTSMKERKSETAVAATKIAAWEAGQSSPSADELRNKKQEDVRRERAGSLALSAVEADARRKADQVRYPSPFLTT